LVAASLARALAALARALAAFIEARLGLPHSLLL